MRHGEAGIVYDAEGIMLDANDEVVGTAKAADATATADCGDCPTLIAGRPDRFMDDITGLPLIPDLCRAARRKEVEFFKSKGVWELRSIDEAIRRLGRRPISIRWVVHTLL